MVHRRVDLLRGPARKIKQWKSLVQFLNQTGDRLPIQSERRCQTGIPSAPGGEDQLGTGELVKIPVERCWGAAESALLQPSFYGLSAVILRLATERREAFVPQNLF